ncbi:MULTISPECIES: hypothetical protein [Vibrio]|uniref:Uncharacterized protein n=1 Tax=Vibrio tasmaniensis TaxID=212663 RepID=A0A2N7NNB9_9VIBR|nr:hypothetical protein [Vibrio tasmaniensis]PMO89895.1 hypothetical protein BCT01_01025 [Vibrio tasmaniensis]PMP17762.1 hypothetical protein BCS92_04980 [Vibrio tasmaniensis]TKG28000.1 hypothetical protein FC057_22700 [Vibrio tasmaniensis]TKG41635.1 hypothetical protein FC063_07170 [Vibrio tasmaniensis]TKG44879.1 hypothetical protein FC061_20305 [Vibrio tasmaniensis]
MLKITLSLDAKFHIGQLVQTIGFFDWFSEERHGSELAACILKHTTGDYGDSCKLGVQLNEASILDGSDSVLSFYEISGQSIRIQTNLQQGVTTLLLAGED